MSRQMSMLLSFERATVPAGGCYAPSKVIRAYNKDKTWFDESSGVP